MNIWRWLVAKWWVSYAIGIVWGIAFGSAVLVAPPNPQITDEQVNYISILISSLIDLSAYLLMVILVFAIILYAFVTRHWLRFLGLVVTTLLLVFMWLSVVGASAGSKFLNPQLFHVESIHVGDYQYNLASYRGLNAWAGYVVYQCDSSGIQCLNIHTEPIYALAYPTLNPELRSDGDAVEFYLNDELLFTTGG